MRWINPVKSVNRNETTMKTLGVLLLLAAVVFYYPLSALSNNSLFAYGFELAFVGTSVLLINRINLIHPCVLFTLYYVYSFALGPFSAAMRSNQYSYNYFEYIVIPLLLFAVGNVVGVHIRSKMRSRTLIDMASLQIPIKRLSFLYFLFGFSLLLSVYYFATNSSAFMADLNSARIDALSGNGAIVYLMALPMVVVPMLLDLRLRADVDTKDAPSKFVLVTITAVSSIALFASGFRSNVASMLVCMLVMYCGRKRVNNGLVFFSGIVLAFFVAFLGMLRSGSDSSLFQSVIEVSYVNGINLQYVLQTFPDRVPYQGGYTYLINLFMLLPGPDQDFTLWLKDQIGVSFSGGGVTPTIVGEFYINFGVLGIGIGMVLLGFIGTRLSNYFEKSGPNFLAVFLVLMFMRCVSGGIANVMISVMLYGIVYKLIITLPPAGVVNKKTLCKSCKNGGRK